MNDKIKDLARIAGATDEIGNRTESVFCFTEPELFDFSERILEECYDVISKVYREMPLEQCSWMLYLEEKIKERFYNERKD